MGQSDTPKSLDSLSREELVAEIEKLRAGIREHRDSSGHNLCWYHPKLWALLPEKVDPQILVPEWPQFLRGCIRYRQSLDVQSPHSPRIPQELQETQPSSQLVWQSTLGSHTGLEFSFVSSHEAEGTLLAFTPEAGAFQVSYSFDWNSERQVNRGTIKCQTSQAVHEVQLQLTENAKWLVSGIGEFDGCQDVDLWPSPLTNFLTLQRLFLNISEKREVQVLYIEAPDLKVRLEKQIYTRIAQNRYWFESNGFSAELQVDEKGLIVCYEGLFKKLD